MHAYCMIFVGEAAARESHTTKPSGRCPKVQSVLIEHIGEAPAAQPQHSHVFIRQQDYQESRRRPCARTITAGCCDELSIAHSSNR